MPDTPTTPRISVALCTHNGARFVREQVASVLAQSLPVDEIVLSDDASSDDTVDIVRRTVDEHNRSSPAPVELRVLENSPALGVVENFQQAVDRATGELIALCDQDDSWHPDKIAVLAAALDAHPSAELAFSDARLVDGSGNPLGGSLFRTLAMTRREQSNLRRGDAWQALLGRNLVTGATVLFRSTLLAAADPFAVDWVHDEWLAAIAAATSGVVMVETPLIDYRQHGGNQIGAAKLGMAEKVGRIAEPRTARNARLLGRSRALVERLDKLGGRVPAQYLADARAKVLHESFRSSLPAGRLARIPGIAGEFLRGRYHRYGRGVIDAGRDLLQPAG